MLEADFREILTCEVRRTPLLGTWANKVLPGPAGYPSCRWLSCLHRFLCLLLFILL
jgi:hypothetical protein